MQFEPNGTVILISGVPFSSDYKDTRYFTSIAEQTTYFQTKQKYVYENCSYTRRTEQYVSVNANIEELWQYNYMMYQNETMGNKWFYAFIDRYEMKAAETTWVYFSIDVIQTWMFDLQFKECFVEREHVGVQTLGQKFYAPENVEYGTNYVTVHTDFIDYVNTNTSGSAVLLASNVDISQSFGDWDNPDLVSADGGVVHRLPTGCDYYVVCPDVYGDASIYDVFMLMKQSPWVSKGIIGMTIIPLYMLSGVNVNIIAVGGGSYSIGRIDSDSAPRAATIFNDNVFSYFDSVSQYKLLMYPYAFIEVSLQNGQTLVIKPQYLNGTNLSLSRTSVISATPEIKYTVGGYEGQGNGYDYSLTINDLPQLPIQDNSYLLSIAQQQTTTMQSANQGLFNNILGGIVSAFTGNVAGVASAVGNSLFDTQRAIYKYNQADAQSPTLSGQVGGSGFNYATEKMGVTIRWKMIASEYRNIVGDYFRKFGYQVNRLKIPNVNKMTRFDYLKTQDAKLAGSIPQDDKVKVIDIYNNGITFWHDDDIGNYNNNTGK